MSAIRIVLLAIALESTALAGVYDLTAFPLVSSDDATVSGTLTTPVPILESTLLTTETEIESFLNSTTYSITLRDLTGSIVHIADNDNSPWDLRLLGKDTEASLLIEPTQLTFDFSSPTEGTSVRLHASERPFA